jgi:Spy/CpxP family protein refolding chaperone
MQKAMIENRAKIQEARVDLKGLFKADNPDRAAIEKKMSEINDLQFKGKLAFVGHLFGVRDLLTPEQQKIWKEHMADEGMSGGEFNGMQGGMMRNPQHQMRQAPKQK